MASTPETAKENACQVCGRDNPVWFAPNEIWNRVFPDRMGFLCPVCFIERADASIPNCGWMLTPEYLDGGDASLIAQLDIKLSQTQFKLESAELELTQVREELQQMKAAHDAELGQLANSLGVGPYSGGFTAETLADAIRSEIALLRSEIRRVIGERDNLREEYATTLGLKYYPASGNLRNERAETAELETARLRSELEQAEAELNTVLNANGGMPGRVSHLLDELGKAEAENKRLIDAVRKYGSHLVVDGVSYCAYYDMKPCNCEFEKALHSSTSTPEEKQ